MNTQIESTELESLANEFYLDEDFEEIDMLDIDTELHYGNDVAFAHMLPIDAFDEEILEII